MSTDNAGASAVSRRQVLAMLAALGVTPEALAQDAPTVAPRSFRVVLENDRVRVLEYKSRPGFGVCGEGMHYHPDHITVSLTGAKLKVATPGSKATFATFPPARCSSAPRKYIPLKSSAASEPGLTSSSSKARTGNRAPG